MPRTLRAYWHQQMLAVRAAIGQNDEEMPLTLRARIRNMQGKLPDRNEEGHFRSREWLGDQQGLYSPICVNGIGSVLSIFAPHNGQ